LVVQALSKSAPHTLRIAANSAANRVALAEGMTQLERTTGAIEKFGLILGVEDLMQRVV
jgi:hypothetical protein